MDRQKALYEFEEILKELNSTPMGRRAFLASVPLLMAACASTEKTRHREGDNTGQKALTVEEERKMTQEALNEMRKDYPPLQDPELQNYMKGLGHRIVAANKLEGNPYNYNFTVVDVGYVNAFALPAGTIYVTAPLLAMADSEAELAGVVGHEVGHVQARHAAERIHKAQAESGSDMKDMIIGGIGGGLVGLGLGAAFCKKKDYECIAKATAAGGAVGAGGVFLVKKYKFMQNSQEDEMEADRIGFRTSVAAGFNKDQVGAFYSKLLKMEEESKKNSIPLLASVADAASTHPPSRNRVAQMNEMAAQTAANPKAVVSSAAFDSARKRVEQYVKSKPKA